MTVHKSFLSRAVGRKFPVLHMHIDAPLVEHSALRCTQQLLYRSCYISCFIVGTLKLWTSRTYISRRLSWHPLASQPSKILATVQCPHSLAMSYVNQPFVSSYPDLTSCSPDARPSRRWIYFPVLRPQQRRRLSSSFTEDRQVRLEPVLSDLTQARRFRRIFRRQNSPREPFHHAVHAEPRWSSPLVT